MAWNRTRALGMTWALLLVALATGTQWKNKELTAQTVPVGTFRASGTLNGQAVQTTATNASYAVNVLQVSPNTTVTLEWNFGNQTTCYPTSTLGSQNWDANHKSISPDYYSTPCFGLVSIPISTTSQTFYMTAGVVYGMSIVVNNQTIAGIGGAPVGTFRAFGQSGETSSKALPQKINDF